MGYTQSKPTDKTIPEGFADRLRAVVDADTVLEGADALAALLAEERGLFKGHARLAIQPKSTAELARAVTLCAQQGVAMVPQGGNTGLVGGSVTQPSELLVSLKRMNRIIDVDPVNYTVTVEAGGILADVQKAAAEVGCLFPLSLGAEGSCTIGGNLATNAGGVGVLKYGNARELVLGIEVVLPDGRIWNGMRPLLKDNSGFSLKNIFVGSEGSVGFITTAILKLFPALAERQTAFCALPSVTAALDLLSLARRNSGDQVTAFELLSDFACSIVCEHAGGIFPLENRAPWYALIELSSSRSNSGLREIFEQTLETAFDAGIVTDAVVAESIDQAQRLWQLRERTPEAQKKAGGSIKNDISIPVSRIPEFISRATKAVEDYMPEIHMCAFGHVGDGNIHYNFSQPDGMDKDEFLSHWHEISAKIHPIVRELNGSISAEHGIGILKLEDVHNFRSEIETEINQRIKNALDPQNLMNPNKFVQ